VGDSAFVSTSWGYLHWVDVSDPANPIDLGFNGGGGNLSREVYAAGDGYLYLAGPDTVRYGINSDGSLVNKYPVVDLVFELTVTDDAGATGTAQMTVSVLPW